MYLWTGSVVAFLRDENIAKTFAIPAIKAGTAAGAMVETESYVREMLGSTVFRIDGFVLKRCLVKEIQTVCSCNCGNIVQLRRSAYGGDQGTCSSCGMLITFQEGARNEQG
jgi:hypothetical protein